MDNDLFERIEELHTTALGEARIRRNLSLEIRDVVGWCRARILSPQAECRREGKNHYVTVNDIVMTINASSMTIITAHRVA